MPKPLSSPANDRQYLSDFIEASERFLLNRPHTKSELRQHFTKKVARPETLDALLTRLGELGFVDDWRFIAWWVGQRNDFKPKGQYALTAELLQKGVEKELVDRYFQENPLQGVELARDALQTRVRRLQQEPADKRFQRAIAFLQRRGFSYDVSKTAFEDLFPVE